MHLRFSSPLRSSLVAAAVPQTAAAIADVVGGSRRPLLASHGRLLPPRSTLCSWVMTMRAALALGVGRYFDPRSHKFRCRIFQFSAANFFKISQNFPTFTRFLRPSPHVVPQGSRTRAPADTGADIYDRYYSRQQRDTSMSLFRSAFSSHAACVGCVTPGHRPA